MALQKIAQWQRFQNQLQAPKSIALGFAPCLLESMREVAVMEIMPNK